MRVEGAKTVPLDRLVKRLTQPAKHAAFPAKVDSATGVVTIGMSGESESENTAWEAGEPAPFDLLAVRSVQSDVRRALADLGYMRAQFRIDTPIDPDPAKKTADLVVQITDEGPASTLASIDVVGCKKNQPQDVVRFLGLEVGKPVDVAALEAAQQKLWDAARFKKHLLTAAPDPQDATKLRLKIDLEEYGPAPALGKPFTDIEQATLKFRGWLLGCATAARTWCSSISSRDGEQSVTGVFVVGYVRGGAIRLSGRVKPTVEAADALLPGTGAPSTKPATGPATRASEPLTDFSAGAAVTDKIVGLYDPTGIKYVSPLGDLGAEMNVEYASRVEDDGTVKWTFNIGGGVTTTRLSPGADRVRLKLTLSPVGFVDLAHQPDTKYELKGGVLLLTGTKFTGRIDAATGRAVELRYESHNDQAVVGSLTARKGALAETVAAMDAAPARNAYEPNHGAASLFSFLSRELFLVAAWKYDVPANVRGRAVEAAAKLLSPRVFEPVGALLKDEGDDDFSIPPDFTSVFRGRRRDGAAVGLLDDGAPVRQRGLPARVVAVDDVAAGATRDGRPLAGRVRGDRPAAGVAGPRPDRVPGRRRTAPRQERRRRGPSPSWASPGSTPTASRKTWPSSSAETGPARPRRCGWGRASAPSPPPTFRRAGGRPAPGVGGGAQGRVRGP